MLAQAPRTVKIIGINGEPVGQIAVPLVFEDPVRRDVISKAVVAQQSHRFQPQGRNPMAGKRTTAEGFGVGRGISRVPRVGGGGPLSGTAAFAPGTVGGRLAFPPVSMKKTGKRVNRKERLVALKSAIAATGSTELVQRRGHKFDKDLELPLVVTDDIEKLSKTSEARRLLSTLGLWEDIERVTRSRNYRGKKKTHAKGPLVVVGEYQGANRAFGNLDGVDVIRAKDLNVELLAPGTHPGRLTIWSESAVKLIAGRNW